MKESITEMNWISLFDHTSQEIILPKLSRISGLNIADKFCWWRNFLLGSFRSGNMRAVCGTIDYGDKKNCNFRNLNSCWCTHTGRRSHVQASEHYLQVSSIQKYGGCMHGNHNVDAAKEGWKKF